ncbi:MAG: ABC transporter permease [Lysobacteraceae bacterium]
MTPYDTIALAGSALRANLLRSVLTALGVIIGIAAVIVMVSIGRGTQERIDLMMSSLGSNRVEIFSGSGRAGPARFGAGSTPSLTQSDAQAIRREIPEVAYVSATMRQSGQVVAAQKNWQTTIYGVEQDYYPINNWTIAQGEWPSARDYAGAAKVAVLGETVARELFDGEDPVGKSLRLDRVPFIVVGVLNARGQGGFGQDQDDVVFVPLTTMKTRLSTNEVFTGDYVQSITVGVGRAEDIKYVEGALAELLRQRHRIAPGATDDFNVRNMAEMISARNETTQLMSVLLASVALISLVVGGIGIMNIMLVSVTERTREIGLRMATGATPGDIQGQFLSEAILISLGGGALGIALGIGGTYLASHLTQLPTSLDAQVILLATAFATATGLFFGYYPARKAARLDPIEALRYE